jgi:hypothetical protein
MLAVPRHFKYLYVAPLAAVEGSVIHTLVLSENKTVSSVVNQMVRFMNFLLVQIGAGNSLITSLMSNEDLSLSQKLWRIDSNILVSELGSNNSGFGGLVVSMLASGIQVHGFKPGQSHRNFRVKLSSACLPSEGK